MLRHFQFVWQLVAAVLLGEGPRPVYLREGKHASGGFLHRLRQLSQRLAPTRLTHQFFRKRVIGRLFKASEQLAGPIVDTEI